MKSRNSKISFQKTDESIKKMKKQKEDLELAKKELEFSKEELEKTREKIHESLLFLSSEINNMKRQKRNADAIFSSSTSPTKDIQVGFIVDLLKEMDLNWKPSYEKRKITVPV